MSNQAENNAGLSDLELCQRYDVQCKIVGDIYDVDLQGNPIPHADRAKWMVTAPAGTFPAALIRSIPLAATENECEALAAKYLMLRDREAFLFRAPRAAGSSEKTSTAIPTPVYLAFVRDDIYWPCTDTEMVYATDLVLEVDGKRYEQGELEPATFAAASEVVIVDGTVYEEWQALHSVREHFENWITGHQPAPPQHQESP